MKVKHSQSPLVESSPVNPRKPIREGTHYERLGGQLEVVLPARLLRLEERADEMMRTAA